MATLESTAPLILPRPGAPRRSPLRRSAATPRGAAMRRRAARQEAPRFSGEQIDTWVLQGLIWLAMAGMLGWFHAPLAQAVRSLF
jgi:hypothetical protein